MIFQQNTNGVYYKVVAPFLEPNAPDQANTFYRSGYTACASNPCMHGGTCTSETGYDYACVCQPGFYGPNCDVAPKKDCTDLYTYYRKNTDGIYWIHPSFGPPMQVYCDMTLASTGAMLIQR